ncbi:MAG: phosphoenolpyruvate carboxykinase (ATP) [Candidatus Omnitrophica bacterium]|nr:phosphoenolpyruvate carboxykinase (ATP) [Candidatus Omnitrophota bacterium]
MLPKELPFKGKLHRNLSVERLYAMAVWKNLAQKSNKDALVFHTGKYTGRVPEAKYVIRESSSENNIDWGKNNRPMTIKTFDLLKAKIFHALSVKEELFMEDCYVGADPLYRLSVTVVSENPVYALFAKTMFIPEIDPKKLTFHQPQFTVIHAPSLILDPAKDGTGKDACILLNFAERYVLIAGTSYAGEIKKSIFSVMNYLMPGKNVLPMHCSANYGKDENDAAIFFGLSGTGKTTLSAAKNRTLVGDDEHGWSDHGIFNFEGGCYAKVIRLSRDGEPEIYATTQKFGTLLENVPIHPKTGEIDLNDEFITENTRASYPISSMPHMTRKGTCGHPKHILMLACDAFGILPPVAKLSMEQAMYHFLAGYTAKVAGTESGIKEPQATFSSCFGAPFMPRHPKVYAELLGRRIHEHQVDVWLINTGWTGGPYGTGTRMNLEYTRAIVDAILENRLSKSGFEKDPHFGFLIPKSCADVPSDLLFPRKTWKDPKAYDQKAHELALMFQAHMKQLLPDLEPEILHAGPQA